MKLKEGNLMIILNDKENFFLKPFSGATSKDVMLCTTHWWPMNVYYMFEKIRSRKFGCSPDTLQVGTNCHCEKETFLPIYYWFHHIFRQKM